VNLSQSRERITGRLREKRKREELLLRRDCGGGDGGVEE
jgi:hypothetical protein